jgi:hypothetical protein
MLASKTPKGAASHIRDLPSIPEEQFRFCEKSKRKLVWGLVYSSIVCFLYEKVYLFSSVCYVSNVAWCTCPASSRPADFLVVKVEAHAFSILHFHALSLSVAVEGKVGTRAVARSWKEAACHSEDQAFQAWGSLVVAVVAVHQTFP